MTSYEKVIEFFNEHETSIYGLSPTDDGVEEGSLLWCIEELYSMFDINVYIDNRDKTIKQRTLKVICTLIDIYEKADAEERELHSEITTLMNDLAASELEVEYLKSKAKHLDGYTEEDAGRIMSLSDTAVRTDDYTYYEIWNTTSKIGKECTERCADFKTAKEHLEKNHCDWIRPFGTGIIYRVNLVPTDDGTINMIRTEAYIKR
jgi:hypothetical protein